MRVRRIESRWYSGLIVIAVALLAGCGSSSKSNTRPKDDPPPPFRSVELTDAGCTPDNFTLASGDIEFSVTNNASTKVKEMEVQSEDDHMVGDVEGVTPGHTRSFVVNLKVGTYRVRCPEDAPAGGSITVK